MLPIGDSVQVIDIDAERKAWTTLAARLALAGHQVWRSNPADAGPIRYFASRWGYIREFADLVAVENFAKQVGA